MTRRHAGGPAATFRPFDDQGGQPVDRLVVLLSRHRHSLNLLDHVVPPTALGAGNVLWIKAAVERGMKPMDALLSATRNVAVAYKRADLGTLEVGKYADFVVLSRDPLASPENYDSIVDVYKEGVRVDREALPTRRIMSKP